MKGIIFNQREAQAVADGRMTQFRRIVKLPAGVAHDTICEVIPSLLINRGDLFDFRRDGDNPIAIKSSCGKVGDQLFVKESFRLFNSQVDCACYEQCECGVYHGQPIYRADSDYEEEKWTPSTRMPERAARTRIEITGVMVERFQSITEKDAIACGIHKLILGGEESGYWTAGGESSAELPIVAYRKMDLEAWNSNPWQFVYDFKVLEDL